jgi:hypothetical protein
MSGSILKIRLPLGPGTMLQALVAMLSPESLPKFRPVLTAQMNGSETTS